MFGSMMKMSFAQRVSPERVPSRLKKIARSVICLVVGLTVLGLVISSVPVKAEKEARQEEKHSDAAVVAFKKDVLPLFKKYCFECHGTEEPEAGLDMIAFSRQLPGRATAARKWEKILQLIESGAMPPADHDPLPTKDEQKRMVKWIDDTIFFVDCERPPDPGRVTIRRLNRAEYNNTIRDLFGIDFKPAKDFPSDDVGYGFDNIGDVLSVQPLLMEKYLDAAESITDKVIVLVNSKNVQHRDPEQLKKTGAANPGPQGFLIMPSTAEVFDRFEIPVTGEYIIRAEAAAIQAGPEKAKVEFRIDGKKIKVFEVEGHLKPGMYETKVKLSRGKRKFAAAFINDYYNPKAEDPKERDRNLGVRILEIEGPVNFRQEDLPETHTRVIFVKPSEYKTVRQAARDILRKLAYRTFRRPVTDEELEKYLKLVEMAVERKESFEEGIQVALQAILVSPHFLFRVETGQPVADASDFQHISDYQLASRLSYFLWSTMPDETLFELATKGTLHRPKVLEQQVTRMLKDRRSKALVENFAAQWLNLRSLEDVYPDRKTFPNFDRKMRNDMRRETELLFKAVMQENRSILDFLDADFTHVNERLAKHYGIPDIKGEKFQKVALTNGQRSGVLTHASILTLTSETKRTSPVKRGKWIMENVLGTPPPPPPPNPPTLEETAKAAKDAPLREQMMIHRINPTCASCHILMDDLGFGFENFDAIGRWRDTAGNKPVDASGKLPTGETFSGPLELVKILKTRDKQFSRCITEKMLTFALGRGLEYYDECTVDKIIDALSRDEYRFNTLVMEIVRSDPFLMRRIDGGVKTK